MSIAGIAQWQCACLPSRIHGSESRCPLCAKRTRPRWNSIGGSAVPTELHRKNVTMLQKVPRATVVGIPAAPQVFLSPAGSTGARSAPTWLLPGPAPPVASPHGEAFFRTASCPPSASWIARLILGEYSLSLLILQHRNVSFCIFVSIRNS